MNRRLDYNESFAGPGGFVNYGRICGMTDDTTETPTVTCEFSTRPVRRYFDPMEFLHSDLTETETPKNKKVKR